MKHYFYFTAKRGNFKNAQICVVWDYNIKKTAEIWGKTNGYNKVFVYDLDHNFVAEYESLAR